jgi:hypothetical protein
MLAFVALHVSFKLSDKYLEHVEIVRDLIGKAGLMEEEIDPSVGRRWARRTSGSRIPS